jgi:hypothetical protein
MNEPQDVRSLWIGNEHTGTGALAGMRAQSPVRCDGLARGPSPQQQQRPGVGSRPPAARLAGCNPAAAAHRAAGPAERCAGPGQWADSLGPPAARAPWPSWMLAAGPPSAVTEFGSQWPSRWRRLATARGRFPELQKRAQLAEESGSIWARPREACHPTPSQWRARHTGATAATPQSASRNKRASPRAKSRGGKDTTTAQPVVTSLLTRETC